MKKIDEPKLSTLPNRVAGYRTKALKAYPPFCVYCGFGIVEVLEIAHLDRQRANNDLDNLAVLCPTCHRMHDIGLIPTDFIKQRRDSILTPDWELLMQGAGKRAAETKRASGADKIAGQKAKETRLANRQAGQIKAVKAAKKHGR